LCRFTDFVQRQNGAMTITVFTIILFGSSLIVTYTSTLAWRRRDVTGGAALTLMFVAVAIWCFFSAMGTTTTSASERYIWATLSYIGVVNVGPLFLVFACQYSDSRWRLYNWVLLLIWSVPVLTLALVFTNDFHHLVWSRISAGPISGARVYHYGPWFMVEMLWSLGLCAAGSYHLLRLAARAARVYVVHAVFLLAAVLVPWVGAVLYLLPHGPFPGLETTCLGFAVSAILMMIAIGRFRFLDLLPQARVTLMEHTSEGVLVLDATDRIVDINGAARRLFGIDAAVIGRSFHDGIPALRAGVNWTMGTPPQIIHLSVEPDMTLEVSISPVVSRVGKRTGRILLIRDISERRRAELEREKLIAELQDALGNVKQLHGLLPICASCKKIRDDQGYWHQVEHYMTEHSTVEFSHGICPQCAMRLYPDLVEPGDFTKK
jgi:PAS domain-containing protein